MFWDSNTLAAVLFGDVNPSGKLPLTFPNNMKETWLKTDLQYPGMRRSCNAPGVGVMFAGRMACLRTRGADRKVGDCVCAVCAVLGGRTGINGESEYSEGLFMGYRWYDQHNLQPLYPFGHGLSYTTFDYSDLQIHGDQITCQVKNSGVRAGAEVVQLYLGYPESAQEPPQLLKGFQKVRTV